MGDHSAMAERFWAKVDRKSRPDGCWEWTAARFAQTGYGMFQLQGRPVGAHRVAYELAVGLIPEGRLVCHRCDNPPCCRPDHLFAGTVADNGRDMSSKGRSNRGRLRPGTGPAGDRNSHAVLDVSAVAAIRVAKGTVRDIAARFGISKSQVSNIRRGVQWKESVHV